PSDPTQLAQIGDLTRDPDLGTRYSAVLALGQIGNPASIPAVRERLALAAGPAGLVPANEPSDKIRRRAATALGRLRSPQAVPLLLGSFADPDWQVNYAARDALAELGAAAVQPLLALAAANDPDAKRAALVDLYIRQALGRMNPVPLAELTSALQSPTVRVRQVAALALGESRAPEAQALLEAVAANDAEPTVKYAAQRGLQLLRVAAAPTSAAPPASATPAPPAEAAAPAAQ
ncbi:MAG: HEAT repeat domain-containing protein, partial [Fimbriimonadaceae bacterium]|nr:HEAT repeat domain-containing protein [Fimbriimonadaceae bacterium]